MKKAAVAALVLALVPFASAQNWFQGTLDQAYAAAKAEGKLVLLDFFSAG